MVFLNVVGNSVKKKDCLRHGKGFFLGAFAGQEGCNLKECVANILDKIADCLEGTVGIVHCWARPQAIASSWNL